MKNDDTMKIAVVGLGVEGKNAVKSLMDYGYDVYASDLKEDIKLEHMDKLDLDLGYHDFDKINKADAVVLSPGLWNSKIGRRIRTAQKLLSDVIKDHRSIFTIGVTGTNGKTTTCFMINEILKKAGLKVLVGGNAGGGFEGYTKLILDASADGYDVLIVEVCDMTLDFCSHAFDFDLVVVTNIGYDHLDFHRSIENYKSSLCKFLDKKTAILNRNDEFLVQIGPCADKAIFFENTNRNLKVFGRFNLQNASAAECVAKFLGIPNDYIEETLENFKGVKGRSTMIKLPSGSSVVVGKTDNVDAAVAVFEDMKFDVFVIGTPREDEKYRFDIIREVSKLDPDIVAFFSGLDDTTDEAARILKEEGYEGEIRILEDVDDVVDFVLECSRSYENTFIGGNGQDKIIKIQDVLQRYAKG